MTHVTVRQGKPSPFSTPELAGTFEAWGHMRIRRTDPEYEPPARSEASESPGGPIMQSVETDHE